MAENIDELDDTQDSNNESGSDNSLSMSDEDFLKTEPPALETEAETVVDASIDLDKTVNQDETENEVVDPSKTDATELVEKAAEEASVETEDTGTTDAAVAAEVDYKAEYERLMAPFNANGIEMKPKSIEDVVRLMQMGANYHKKMAGLKPSMKVLKLLEKNDLLDQDKLNFLIDLNSKNPAAITKLLKESGMDPLDINVQEETGYQPTPRNVSDTEIDLDSVLDAIKDTPTYSKTLNVITKVWDDASRSVVAGMPNIISVINGHIADGTYDKVMGAVVYERSLGNLQGVSDLEAYKQTGDKLQALGQLGSPQATHNSGVPARVTPVKPKVNSKDENVRQAQKKAASPTQNVGKAAATTFNPLEMSDEDIEKFDESKLFA